MKNFNMLILILFFLGNGLSISMPPLIEAAGSINTELEHMGMQALDDGTAGQISQQEIDELYAKLKEHSDKQDDSLLKLIDNPSNYAKERRPAAAAQEEQSSAGSAAQSPEEIEARNRIGQLQKMSLIGLPLIPAVAHSTQSANLSVPKKVSVKKFICVPCARTYKDEHLLEAHHKRVHGKGSLQKKYQCIEGSCKARYEAWGWMKKHAFAVNHGLPFPDHETDEAAKKWRNPEANCWKDQSLAASGAPSLQEIAARNKKDAEFNGSQQRLQDALPAVAAAASSSQAVAHSSEKEKIASAVGAKRHAAEYPEKEPAAKKQKSQEKLTIECDKRHIGDLPPKFPCSIKACKDVFNSLEGRNYHIQNSHLNKKKYECHIPKCGATFTSKPCMEKHNSNHNRHDTTKTETAPAK